MLENRLHGFFHGFHLHFIHELLHFTPDDVFLGDPFSSLGSFELGGNFALGGVRLPDL